ncbi:MAG TPA: cellulase-like family protein [Bryobacteraceae bacterium]|nr:cellulase-like family protein [Bryobacteraceae bacterium]
MHHNRLTRREFSSDFAAGMLASPFEATRTGGSLRRHIRKRPLAITMWDFSWLERRWPGAGYENWDKALDELRQRGYDAVRIDAYPHLIAAGPERVWELLPQWNTQDWGAPARCRVQVQPLLNRFIAKCAERELVVALSTWFREDVDKTRLRISEPAELGRIWRMTLDSIAAAGLLKHLLYVDLCNEWPLDVWAPFYPRQTPRASPEGVRWMTNAIAAVRDAYPHLDYTFSFTSEYKTWREQKVGMLDLLELHIWMTQWSDFYRQVGYKYERFDPKGYDNMALHAEQLYRSKPEFWKARLEEGIEFAAEWARTEHKPLITTECWSVVDYKDFPLLAWDWVIELCEHGVRRAARTGQWHAMATSNFCGPQFVGMWRDVSWHRRMTDVIHSAALPS